MRVIAGKYRSRVLKGPGKLRMRPTSDRLRETLFNVLGASVEDSLFVDLFQALARSELKQSVAARGRQYSLSRMGRAFVSFATISIH